MGLSDQLAQTHAALGETVIDPSHWPDVMERICEVIGAFGAVLMQPDIQVADTPRTKSVDEGMTRYEQEHWQIRDSRIERAVPLILAGARVFTDEDLFSYDDFKADAYLNDFYFPWGGNSAAGIAFKAGTALWTLCLHRFAKQRIFDENDASILATFSDRLSEVATLSTAVGHIALANVVSALDLIRQPALAIDRLGCVLDANSSAHLIFDENFTMRHRRLTTTICEASVRLDTLVNKIRYARDDAPLAVSPIIVRRAEKNTIVIRTLPIPPAARNPFLGARALLTFTEVGPKPELDQQLLRDTFLLTRAESRIAVFIAKGLSTETIAEQIGVSERTVRAQLGTIFNKTKTNRQPELVALLSGLV